MQQGVVGFNLSLVTAYSTKLALNELHIYASEQYVHTYVHTMSLPICSFLCYYQFVYTQVL